MEVCSRQCTRRTQSCPPALEGVQQALRGDLSLRSLIQHTREESKAVSELSVSSNSSSGSSVSEDILLGTPALRKTKSLPFYMDVFGQNSELCRVRDDNTMCPYCWEVVDAESNGTQVQCPIHNRPSPQPSSSSEGSSKSVELYQPGWYPQNQEDDPMHRDYD